MEQTILFKGYNKRNHKWIEGYYLMNRGAHFVCPDEWANGKTWMDYEVDPESVGQYIGVNDTEGRKIFSGDRIAVNYGDGIIAIDTVVWLNAGASFMALEEHGTYHVIVGDATTVVGNRYVTD